MSDAAHTGRIGPNAVIRLAEALDAVESKAVTMQALQRRRSRAPMSVHRPQAMVPEDEVTVLHRQLCAATWAQARAASVSWIAGLRTADYLLANRIPKPVQRLLKMLPRRLAAFILLKAIGAHAWTFAGTSRFSWSHGPPHHAHLRGLPPVPRRPRQRALLPATMPPPSSGCSVN